jgi:hypothetical protein
MVDSLVAMEERFRDIQSAAELGGVTEGVYRG